MMRYSANRIQNAHITKAKENLTKFDTSDDVEEFIEDNIEKYYHYEPLERERSNSRLQESIL